MHCICTMGDDDSFCALFELFFHLFCECLPMLRLHVLREHLEDQSAPYICNLVEFMEHIQHVFRSEPVDNSACPVINFACNCASCMEYGNSGQLFVRLCLILCILFFLILFNNPDFLYFLPVNAYIMPVVQF